MRTTGPVGRVVDGVVVCAATASGVATSTRVVVEVLTSRSQPRTLSAAPAGRGPMKLDTSASTEMITVRTPIGTVRSRSASDSTGAVPSAQHLGQQPEREQEHCRKHRAERGPPDEITERRLLGLLNHPWLRFALGAPR